MTKRNVYSGDVRLTQLMLADWAKVALKNLHEPKAKISIHGSLLTGNYDRFSDIDILAAFPTRDSMSASAAVVQAMKSAFPLVIQDIAASLLPKTPIISFFLQNTPVFWNIDVEIRVPPEGRNLTRDHVANDPVGHLLKLWVHTFKHRIRRDARAEQELLKVWLKIAGDRPKPKSAREILKESLRIIAEMQADHDFVANCERILSEEYNRL